MSKDKADLILADEVYAIIGTAIEVHRELGPGFLESVYQEALELEFRERGIPFISQKPLHVHYKSWKLEKTFVPDLICYDCIIVELKAITRLSEPETAQILNYIKAANRRVGLLVNFGSSGKLEWRRYIF